MLIFVTFISNIICCNHYHGIISSYDLGCFISCVHCTSTCFDFSSYFNPIYCECCQIQASISVHVRMSAKSWGRYKQWTQGPVTRRPKGNTKSQNTDSFITTLHYRRLFCIVVQVSNTVFLSLTR